MNITGCPVLHVNRADLLIFGEGEPDFIGRGASGVRMERKVLGYFNETVGGQPAGRLRRPDEVYRGPHSLPLRMIAQPRGDFSADLVSTITATRSAEWKPAPGSLVEP